MDNKEQNKKTVALGLDALSMAISPSKNKTTTIKQRSSNPKRIAKSANMEKQRKESAKCPSMKTPIVQEEGREGVPKELEDANSGYDLTTEAGIRDRLAEIANGPKDNSAIAALKTLLTGVQAEKDPDSKIDPAEICAFLARAQLWGEEPSAVMMRKFGLRKVLRALAISLGFDSISVVIGEQTSEYVNETQCLQGIATDKECVAGSGEQ